MCEGARIILFFPQMKMSHASHPTIPRQNCITEGEAVTFRIILFTYQIREQDPAALRSRAREKVTSDCTETSTIYMNQASPLVWQLV